jgi:hypothetical protein
MADRSNMQSDGGQAYVTIAAGTLAETVAVTGAGRICRIHATTNGTASLAVWDSSTTSGAATAVQLVATTATFAVGTSITVNVPFINGILPKQITNTPGVCITYTRDVPRGAT